MKNIIYSGLALLSLIGATPSLAQDEHRFYQNENRNGGHVQRMSHHWERQSIHYGDSLIYDLSHDYYGFYPYIEVGINDGVGITLRDNAGVNYRINSTYSRVVDTYNTNTGENVRYHIARDPTSGIEYKFTTNRDREWNMNQAVH